MFCVALSYLVRFYVAKSGKYFLGACLMRKHKAHAATDVTGFGILGHADNLAKFQKNEVAFSIHSLPIIENMVTVAKLCNMSRLLKGTSPETSGTINSLCIN